MANGWRQACCLLVAVGLSGVAAQSAPLRVLCTTTHLGAAASAIGGDAVEVTTIIPFGMCPGHFDLTPRQAEALRLAELVFYHGYERFITAVASGLPEGAVQRVAVAGNWMIPGVHREGAIALAALLSAARPERAEAFAENLRRYLAAIDAAVAEQGRVLAALRGQPVLGAAMNSDVAEDLGFRVIGTFPRDDELSAQHLAALLAAGKSAGVRLIIENLQSGGKAGAGMARELGARMAVLTNFPAADGYPAALRQNTAALQAVMTAVEAAP